MQSGPKSPDPSPPRAAYGKRKRSGLRYYFRPRADSPGDILHWGRMSWGDNLFTTAGPLTVSLGLSLAISCPEMCMHRKDIHVPVVNYVNVTH